MKEFSHLILLEHFAPSTHCFYTLFLPLKLPTTRDVNSTNEAFLLEVSVTSVPPSSRSLSRERERKRSQHSFLYTESKSPRLESLFQPTPAVFAPKKRDHFFKSLLNARKFSRVIKHSKRVSRTKANEKVFHESARDSLCVDVVLAFGRSVLLRKLFERDNRARESAKEFHSCRRQN